MMTDILKKVGTTEVPRDSLKMDVNISHYIISQYTPASASGGYIFI